MKIHKADWWPGYREFPLCETNTTPYKISNDWKKVTCKKCKKKK